MKFLVEYRPEKNASKRNIYNLKIYQIQEVLKMTQDSIKAAQKIRELSLRMVHKAKASHIGSALSIADVLAVLITNENICDLKSPGDPSRDRLILSKGHACVALYSALCVKDYFKESNFKTGITFLGVLLMTAVGV